MSIIVVLVVAFLLTGGGVKNYFKRETVQEVKTITQETQNTNEEEEEVKGVKIENQVSFETSKESLTNSQDETQDFIYPGSNFVTQEDSFRVYKVNKEASEVTDWYEAKIKEKDLGATSIVRTKTNGQVLNKLSAASSNYKIEIEITSNDSITTIRLKD